MVQLRYNSGRSIDANGRNLAVMLEALLERWPVPVTQLVIVGHSMGGLVARSAIHHGTAAGHSWRARLRKLFSLGTPHHGAPLERGGNRLDYVMELSPYVAPFTSLGKARSAGITDLRYGSITDVEHEFVPLPDDVECYALAATLGKRRGLLADRLVGDGLVPLDSALGQHPTRAHPGASDGAASGSATRWDTSSCSVAPKCIRSWKNGCVDDVPRQSTASSLALEHRTH